MATLIRLGRLMNSKTLKFSKLTKCSMPVNVIKPRTFSCSSLLLSERKYSDKHEWVTLDGNVGTIGISEYAQDSLGDIVYVQLPDEGDEFDQDDECGALESVKAASEIYAPLSGKITAKNNEAEENPAIINKSPYEQGWLFKLELSKPEEMNELMDEEGYKKFLKSQED